MSTWKDSTFNFNKYTVDSLDMSDRILSICGQISFASEWNLMRHYSIALKYLKWTTAESRRFILIVVLEIHSAWSEAKESPQFSPLAKLSDGTGTMCVKEDSAGELWNRNKHWWWAHWPELSGNFNDLRTSDWAHL